MCKWQEEAKIEVCSQVIGYEIQSRICVKAPSDEILNELLRFKYNPAKAHYYYQKISNIRQRNFLKIKTYVNNITDVCRKLGICCRWSDELINENIEETHYVNLESCVKMEMMKLGNKNLIEIYETIGSIENMIIEELYKERISSGKNNSQIKNSRQNNYGPTTTINKKTLGKYCDAHQSRSHSNEECRKQRLKKENDSSNNPKGYAMCEPIPKPKIIEMGLKMENKKYKALIDTGAKYNFMSNNIANHLIHVLKN
ncbi:hypothetical protein DMUE_2260 [Dictyocoela muelleri]|nr:hypothetical protein DMUE_2260 [Dictyocoela muelleri]